MSEVQKIECVFIKEEYFKEHPEFVKMLDPGNTGKQHEIGSGTLRPSQVPLRQAADFH